MVRVIRTFRPLVVVSAWSGTPNDEHGHHQAAGFLTREAVRAAADPSRYPEQLRESLRPWKVKKLYIRSGGRFSQGRAFEPQPYTLSINTGEFDPVLGRSYYEIAMEGRSKHRSQDQGALERRGAQWSRLRLIQSEVGDSLDEKDIFEGLDIGLTGIVSDAGSAGSQFRMPLAEVQRDVEEAITKFNPFNPSSVTPAIARGLKRLREIRSMLRLLDQGLEEVKEMSDLLARKESEFQNALLLSQGVVIDALADDEMLTPGQTFQFKRRGIR